MAGIVDRCDAVDASRRALTLERPGGNGRAACPLPPGSASVWCRCAAATTPRPTSTRAVAGIREAAARGAQVVCLPELFRTQYFCQGEDAALFDLAEPIPGPTTEAPRRRRAARRASSSSARSSSGGRRASTTTRPSSSTPTARSAASTARCTSPTTRSTTRSTTSRPATSASRRSTPRVGTVGTLVCWDQWYPEAARLTALAGRRGPLLPDGHRLAPAREGRVRRARRPAPGRPMQRAHAIANGVFVAAVNRVGHEGPADGGLEFWGGSFVADPFGVVLAEAPRDERRDPGRRVRPAPLRRRPAATGPSSATAGSTPTAPITQRFLDAMTPLTPAHARRARVPDARRVGAARGDLDRLAAQAQRLAGGSSRRSRWVYAEIVRHLAPRRARPHPRATTRRPSGRARALLRRAGVDRERVDCFRKRHRPRLDPRLGPDLRRRRRRRATVALVDWRFNGWAKYDNHRATTAVPRPLARRRRLTRWAPDSRRSAGATPRRARRRRHRRQRPRDAADDRGVPAQPDPGAQPRARPRRRSSGCFADYLGVPQRRLARPRHRRRRHPRPRRRPGPVRRPAHGRRSPSSPTRATRTTSRLQENRERLPRRPTRTAARSASSPLPMPAPVVFDGQRLPASYANFYIANGVVLVPTFNDPADRGALGILADLFPDRQVVGIHAVDLVLGLGHAPLPDPAAAGLTGIRTPAAAGRSLRRSPARRSTECRATSDRPSSARRSRPRSRCRP